MEETYYERRYREIIDEMSGRLMECGFKKRDSADGVTDLLMEMTAFPKSCVGCQYSVFLSATFQYHPGDGYDKPRIMVCWSMKNSFNRRFPEGAAISIAHPMPLEFPVVLEGMVANIDQWISAMGFEIVPEDAVRKVRSAINDLNMKW